MVNEIINKINFQAGFNHVYYFEKDEKSKQYLKDIQSSDNSLSYGRGLEGQTGRAAEQFVQQYKKFPISRKIER